MIGKTISHYKILEKLGEGGMGVVYKAKDTKLDRFVALKFLPLHLTKSQNERDRFIQEAKAASAINHPNVCVIHDIQEQDDPQFIIMEYVDGETLSDKIKAGNINKKVAIDYAIQIADALKAAHEKGIIHRDIKSENIMITSTGQVKVMDFGLAKLKGSLKLTKTSSTVGTLAYMSPEQIQGGEIDARSDIFSFGVVLYEMLSGRLPFQGEYDSAMMYSILNNDPELIIGMPNELAKVVIKILVKDPRERYYPIDKLITDLRTHKKEIETEALKQKISDEEKLSSIAVLPFINMSADKEQDYFCDGMTEEIINALSHIENLRVIARTSSFAFKDKQEDVREIGKKLDVEHLLEGSVRKAGNRLRITAQLVKVSDGSHLWSERYDRELKDVFDIQDEITLAIVDNLKVKLLRKEKATIFKRYTKDSEAYNMYIKGSYYWQLFTTAGYEKANECFQQAIEKDPNYALVYEMLCRVCLSRAFYENLPPHEA